MRKRPTHVGGGGCVYINQGVTFIGCFTVSWSNIALDVIMSDTGVMIQ